MDKLLLSDLLAHRGNGGLTMVVGAPDTMLPAVVVESSEENLPREVAGSMAVLTLRPPAETWRQDALIRRVRDRGFRALAMPCAASFGAGSQILAQRLGLALLESGNPMELAHASWQLLQGRDSMTLTYVRKAARSFEYQARNLNDLIAHVAANMGQGVALISVGEVLIEAGGVLPRALLPTINFSPWLDTLTAEQGSIASVRVDSPGRPGLRLALFGTRCSEVQLGAMAMAVEVLMPAVAARIMMDQVSDANDAAVAAGLLGDFLERRAAPDPEIEQRMIENGWRIAGYHLGFRVAGRSRIDTFALLRRIQGDLAKVPLESYVATLGRGVSGWLNFSEPPSLKDIEEHVAALRGMHLGLRRSFDVAMGVGTIDSGPVGLAESLAGAAEAARIAADRSAAGWFVRMDALGVEQLLLSWTESDTFVPAAQSLLAPLAEIGGDLMETLSAYLNNESNVKETAAALGLHRNTVTGRISRIQGVLGLDLEDPETRLALHLACRAIVG